MLEKLSKSSVIFKMTTLERLHHILSYSCLFEVLFASLENLLKKLQFIHNTIETKISFYLRENKLQSRYLIMKNVLSPTLGKITS